MFFQETNTYVTQFLGKSVKNLKHLSVHTIRMQKIQGYSFVVVTQVTITSQRTNICDTYILEWVIFIVMYLSLSRRTSAISNVVPELTYCIQPKNFELPSTLMQFKVQKIKTYLFLLMFTYSRTSINKGDIYVLNTCLLRFDSLLFLEGVSKNVKVPRGLELILKSAFNLSAFSKSEKIYASRRAHHKLFCFVNNAFYQ